MNQNLSCKAHKISFKRSVLRCNARFVKEEMKGLKLWGFGWSEKINMNTVNCLLKYKNQLIKPVFQYLEKLKTLISYIRYCG